MRLIIVIISFFISAISLSQDVNFGINFGVNPFTSYKFIHNSDTYKPAHSFYTYTAKEQGTGIIVDEKKFFNTIHFGFSARISRKKIGVNFEPQMVLEYSRFNFTGTSKNNIRVLSRKGLRLPIYITYHLFNNPLAIHLNAGLILSSTNYYDYQAPDNDFFTSSDSAYVNTINNGTKHFYDVFYDRSELTTQYMVGFGKKLKRLDYNLRYVNSLANSSLLGTRWQIELHLNFFFLSKAEFSTKNYLYEE